MKECVVGSTVICQIWDKLSSSNVYASASKNPEIEEVIRVRLIPTVLM